MLSRWDVKAAAGEEITVRAITFFKSRTLPQHTPLLSAALQAKVFFKIIHTDSPLAPRALVNEI